METQITLGWKTIDGKHYIAISVMPKGSDEWMELTSNRPYDTLDDLKRDLDGLAAAMFPDSVAERITVQ